MAALPKRDCAKSLRGLALGAAGTKRACAPTSRLCCTRQDLGAACWRAGAAVGRQRRTSRVAVERMRRGGWEGRWEQREQVSNGEGGIARVRGGSGRSEAGRPARSRAGGAGRGDERIAAWQAVLSEPGRDEAVQIGAVRNAVGRTKRGVKGRGVRCVAGQTWRYGTVRSGVGRCRASVTGRIGVLRCSAARCG